MPTFYTPVKKLILLFSLLILFGCQTAQDPSTTPQPTVTATTTHTPVPSPLPTSTPFAQPPIEFIESADPVFTVELNQPFMIYWDQRVQIAGTNLSILHTTDIEFECSDDFDCETSLIAFDYFSLYEGDELLIGNQSWEPILTLGDYILTTADKWSDDNYDSHQFGIIMTISTAEEVASAEATRTADPAHAQITTNCSDAGIDEVSHYFSANLASPELHAVAIYRGSGNKFDLTIERSHAPIILFLSASEPVEWRINKSAETKIGAIILNGRSPHTISGLNNDAVTIHDKTGNENSFTNFLISWSGDTAAYENGLAGPWLYALEAFTDAKISSFTGCYQASEATIR